MTKIKKFLKHKINYDIFQLYFFRKDINVAYKVIPKVACTSIKSAMTNNVYSEFFWIHEPITKNIEQIKNVIDVPNNTYVFTFCRNPFDRLLSCYKAINETGWGPRGTMQQNWLSAKLLFNRNFTTFVIKVILTPHILLDQHLQSQYKIIYTQDKIHKIDFIGKFENLQNDFEHIKNKYQIGNLKKLNATKRSYKDLYESYNRLTAKFVYWKYRKDVKCFGYYDWYKKFIKKL